MKIHKILPFILMGILFVSCTKDTKNEWEQFNGYTNEDIIGSYTFSNVSNAFESLSESSYCHLCDDAKISITSYLDSGNSIEFKISCTKASFNKSFDGRPKSNTEDYIISMSDPSWGSHHNYELLVYVYKNAKGEIRLHGFARHIHHPGTDEEYNVNYYFDVLKN